jgi:hypothetical protein
MLIEHNDGSRFNDLAVLRAETLRDVAQRDIARARGHIQVPGDLGIPGTFEIAVMVDRARNLDIPIELSSKPAAYAMDTDAILADASYPDTTTKALTLDAHTGEGLAAHTNLGARRSRGASTVDACSSRSGRQSHYTLLVTLSVYACMLFEDWIAAPQRTKGLAGPITTHDTVVVAGLGKTLNTVVMHTAPGHSRVVSALTKYPRS